eukprot:1891533-Amphidinium_carterae.1
MASVHTQEVQRRSRELAQAMSTPESEAEKARLQSALEASARKMLPVWALELNNAPQGGECEWEPQQLLGSAQNTWNASNPEQSREVAWTSSSEKQIEVLNFGRGTSLPLCTLSMVHAAKLREVGDHVCQMPVLRLVSRECSLPFTLFEASRNDLRYTSEPQVRAQVQPCLDHPFRQVQRMIQTRNNGASIGK